MRGYPTTPEIREKILAEYQNGAKIPNLMHRYKLSDKTIKRIVGVYEFDYHKTKKSENKAKKANVVDAEAEKAEKVVTEFIESRIRYLNEQIVKLSDEKKKLREFYDYLTENEKMKKKKKRKGRITK